ncbi:MAG: hypothetical protein HQ596_00960, partial [Candidatus Saganbacteria bacterium]|nr:hypothetical protein [Candidatus Saganbacteria bacterium]
MRMITRLATSVMNRTTSVIFRLPGFTEEIPGLKLPARGLNGIANLLRLKGKARGQAMKQEGVGCFTDFYAAVLWKNGRLRSG